MPTDSYDSYIGRLIGTMWDYCHEQYGSQPELLETAEGSPTRPPVFLKSVAEHNLLMPPFGNAETNVKIENSIPRGERHRYFGSMRSSQALAQSVFGALSALDKLGVLCGLNTEDGLPVFFDNANGISQTLEYGVTHLGEPRPTSLDVWFQGSKRVAVECKLTEPEFGTCSRPRLREGKDSNYERDHCDGTYSVQRGRQSRCSLTEIGVGYWTHVPELFDWAPDRDLAPCPLRETYQLVRNVLAACVLPSGEIDTVDAHALIVYDERNPAYVSGGQADKQWNAAARSLKHQGLLRRCSWQRLVAHISTDADLAWLVAGLEQKYGIVG